MGGSRLLPAAAATSYYCNATTLAVSFLMAADLFFTARFGTESFFGQEKKEKKVKILPLNIYECIPIY